MYDEKIPVFLAETFSRLWGLWVDQPVMRKVIRQDTFHDLYKDMSSLFEAKAGSRAPVPSTSVGGSGQRASADDILLNRGAISEPPHKMIRRGLFLYLKKIPNRITHPLAEVIDIDRKALPANEQRCFAQHEPVLPRCSKRRRFQ